MPVTPSYPGIYIQELTSSAHTITASPTNIAVFIGYSHPFKTTFPLDLLNGGTKQATDAIQLFSFTDYETYFGGLFHSGDLSPDLPYAVYQFFLNGGTDCYVVGLKANGGQQFSPATVSTSDKINFSALNFTSTDNPITINIQNIQKGKSGNLDTADITILSSTQAETYRKVSLDAQRDPKTKLPTNANFIVYRIGSLGSQVSQLVALVPSDGSDNVVTDPNFPTSFAKDAAQSYTIGSAPAAPAGAAALPSLPNPIDFMPVFAQDSSLDNLPIFNLMALPGITDPGILTEAISFCERKQAFFIMDPPQSFVATQGGPDTWIGDYAAGTNGISPPPMSANTALYFPYLKAYDPLSPKPVPVAPSGFVTGIICRTDDNRGVWKAPAGQETTINNTAGVVATGAMNDMRQGTLNPLGVNCLRDFPDIGTVVYGARTIVTANTAYLQWRYVSVRRTALFIEQTLYRNLGWVVFEPNDTPLWVSIKTSIEAFMLTLFKQGAFQGDTPSDAFQVLCDSTTTSQADIDNGIVNIIVAFAPLKPAEFVIVKIAQLAGQSQS
jgi:phage tail sheath protein FI